MVTTFQPSCSSCNCLTQVSSPSLLSVSAPRRPPLVILPPLFISYYLIQNTKIVPTGQPLWRCCQRRECKPLWMSKSTETMRSPDCILFKWLKSESVPQNLIRERWFWRHFQSLEVCSSFVELRRVNHSRKCGRPEGRRGEITADCSIFEWNHWYLPSDSK